MSESQHPFLVLIQQHSAAISKVCRSFCPKNADDQADLRQDIILNLWQGWKSYRPTHKQVTWVWRVAVNTAISFRRRSQHRVGLLPLPAFDLPADEESSLRDELNDLIRRLPPNDQQLLSLYLDGWRQSEIAALLHISESNVQTRISRIKVKLKSMNQ